MFGSLLRGNSRESVRVPPPPSPAPEPVSPSISHESSTDDSYYSESDWSVPFNVVPKDNFGTNVACIFFSGLSHYVYGIFFNAYETVNSKYGYPNIGSMCFVLATALYLIRYDLSLKRMPIERTWKYSVYKVLAVTFLTHLILAGIWQQLVNLTWELTFIIKDFFDVIYQKTGNFIFKDLSSLITMTTARWITYLEGLAILVFVLISLNSRSYYEEDY